MENDSILKKSFNKALGGGISGASAMICQVTSLMWMRTIMNYQYRHGTTLSNTAKILYKDGGIRRFYRGIGPALLQGPLSRFGDTAANTGILTALNSSNTTKDLPISIKTFLASTTAALWRINLMPIDNIKTSLQVNGKQGIQSLKTKIKTGGFKTMYHGSLAAFGATFIGHYPWFFTYNYLNNKLPKHDTLENKFISSPLIYNLLRNGTIGFCSSFMSDISSNSIRVLKTYKQSSTEIITYNQAIKQIIKQDGILGLFGRGLKTRIIANGIQGMLFTILWKYFQDKFN